MQLLAMHASLFEQVVVCVKTHQTQCVVAGGLLNPRVDVSIQGVKPHKTSWSSMITQLCPLNAEDYIIQA